MIPLSQLPERPFTCSWLSETFPKKDRMSSDQYFIMLLVGNYLVKSLPERIVRKLPKIMQQEYGTEQGGPLTNCFSLQEITILNLSLFLIPFRCLNTGHHMSGDCFYVLLPNPRKPFCQICERRFTSQTRTLDC